MTTPPPPPPTLPPPTRQLFVRFPVQRPRSHREVEELFRDFGRVKHAHLGKSGDVAFVSFWRLEDAREALHRLDRREWRGYELRVEYSRVTRLLAVGDVPRGAPPSVADLVRGEVAAHRCSVEWAEYDAHRATVYVQMRSEADAARAVSELQGRDCGGWRWEVEFYKEAAVRPPPARREAPPNAAAAAAATPPAGAAAAPREAAATAHHATPAPAPPAAAATAAASPLVPSPTTPAPAPLPAPVAVGAAGSAATPAAAPTAAPASGRDEPSRSPARRARSRSRSHSPPGSRSRSRSRSRSPARSRSRSPPRKGRRTAHYRSRSRSHSRSRSRSRSQSRSQSPPAASRPAAPSSASPSIRRDRRRSHHQRRSASPAASPARSSPPPPAAPIECPECSRLVTHLSGADHHSITEDEQTKQLVKAWFSGNFELASKRDPTRKPESIRRLRFLDEHVNPFLASVGLPTWTTRTPLYANWFQREVLRLSAAEVGHSRPLLLHRRTSLQAYAERLRRLLAEVEKQLG